MTTELTIVKQQEGFSLHRSGKPQHTPMRQPLLLPTKQLAEAVALEWTEGKKFSPKNMPLSSLAFTALDVVQANAEKMIQVMLAYAETDLLFYRSEVPELRTRQDAAWAPVVEWAQSTYGCDFIITAGVMPVNQPPATMTRLTKAMEAFSPFEMAGFSVMTQSLGSLLLALALKEGEINAEKAFKLSRIDEDYQTEQWGEDSVSLARAQEIAREVKMALQFVRLQAA